MGGRNVCSHTVTPGSSVPAEKKFTLSLFLVSVSPGEGEAMP